MVRFFRFIFACTFLIAGLAGPAHARALQLIVFIVVDGVSLDQMDEQISELDDGGIKHFRKEGAWFTNASYRYAVTLTGCGHATLLTGTYPEEHGIVANSYIDRETAERLPFAEEVLKAPWYFSRRTYNRKSPYWLRKPTLGDLLIEASGGQAGVFAVSVKDRAAVMSAGHKGTAYYYDEQKSRFVTSAYYSVDHPGWWKLYYERKELPEYQAPYPEDAYTGDFALALLKAEGLGRFEDAFADLLVVSFSKTDSANHNYGPESAEALAQLRNADRGIVRLFDYVERAVGIDRTLFVLTADHGFSKSVDYYESRAKDTGFLDVNRMLTDLMDHLEARFGAGDVVAGWARPYFYFNEDLIRRKGLKVSQIESSAREFLRAYPGVGGVYIKREILESGRVLTEQEEMVARSMHPEAGGEIYVLQKPYWVMATGAEDDHQATHGTPYEYDTRVPLAFLGLDVKTGKDETEVDMADVMPAVARLAGLEVREPDEGVAYLVKRLGV